MMKTRWTTKQWIVFSSTLLVLGVLASAYFVYVPKLKEWQTLQDDLRIAREARVEMLNREVPQNVTDLTKKQLSEAVPAELDQARFLKLVREVERASGVTIKSLLFDAQHEAKTSAKSNQGQHKQTTSVLQERMGMLSLEGNYTQVRAFLEGFSKLPRLITLQKWELTTESREMRDEELMPKTEDPNRTEGTTLTQQVDLSNKVKMNISFKMYLAPDAKHVLPAAEPLQTYQPSNRKNAVHSW
jgi:Tfp pilus assembly protein PilO